MPDDRRHRGPHPEDAALFGPPQHAALRAAVADLSWLLTRDYATPSAVKVVGDRYGLTARQRTAVMRSSCPDDARAARRAREIPPASLAGRRLLIDGYNVLTTVEAAMAGGVILVGRDGCWRDMASMHGTWRRVEETAPAIARVAAALALAAPAEVVWYLDAPVSNSGRLKVLIESAGAEFGWRVELVPDPDKLLGVPSIDGVVASADSAILDRCAAWTNLARAAAEPIDPIWRLDFSA